MTDRDIMIAHLVLYDAETAAEAVAWRAHISGYFDEMVNSEHFGDCTNMAITCRRCLADEALRMVPVYRELFGVVAP